MKKILIFGRNGQVSTDLISQFQDKKNYSVDVVGSSDIDIGDSDKFKKFLSKFSDYDIVINASAYNLVDKAEEEYEKALKINRDAVKIMAEFCKNSGSLFIHYSTNYVFDGKNPKANLENDANFIKPLSKYAISKLEGEKVVQDSGCNYLIFRLATVFRENKINFVAKMLELFTKNKELKIVDDQISNPSYSHDIAKATIEIIEKNPDKKYLNQIYHLANEGCVSYFTLCRFIYDQAKDNDKFNVVTEKIEPISSSDYKTPAMRPLNGEMDLQKIKNAFGIKMPSWQDAVKRAILKTN